MSDIMRAFCGLDCGGCPAHVAMVNNDDALRAKTAVEWNEMFAAFGASYKVEDINCAGCRVSEGLHSGYCCACPLRSCGTERGVDSCYVCGDFADCGKVKEFEKHSNMSIAGNFQ